MPWCSMQFTKPLTLDDGRRVRMGRYVCFDGPNNHNPTPDPDFPTLVVWEEFRSNRDVLRREVDERGCVSVRKIRTFNGLPIGRPEFTNVSREEASGVISVARAAYLKAGIIPFAAR